MVLDSYRRPSYGPPPALTRGGRSPPRYGRPGRRPPPRELGRGPIGGGYARPAPSRPLSVFPSSSSRSRWPPPSYPSRPSSRRRPPVPLDGPYRERERERDYTDYPPQEERFEDEVEVDVDVAGASPLDHHEPELGETEDLYPPDDWDLPPAEVEEDGIGDGDYEPPPEPEPPRKAKAKAKAAVAAVKEEPPPKLPEREDDLSLDAVPEELRETVQGNMALKRALSTDTGPVSNGSAKRRKLELDYMNATVKPLDKTRKELLDKWRLAEDVAARYVIEAAELEDVESLKKTGWQPGRLDSQKSACEQIAEKLKKMEEAKCPAGSNVDAVTAFTHRWGLSTEEGEELRKLCHKDLRHVMTNYDASRPIEELVEEARMEMPGEEAMADGAPDKPGLYTLGRFNRLELIDPVADALVLGDANLTFSLLLAQHREGLGHVGRIVATTFETIETLRERYSEIDDTVRRLEETNAEVLHNVDCTRLAVDPRFVDMQGKFGAVYYNFPHAGVVKGFFDSHPFVRWRHENLMHMFFRALRGFVKPGGVVKVSSNSNATGVRYTDIMKGAQLSEFVHVETLPFLEWQLRGYRRSYGDRRDANRRPEDGEIYKSQRAHADMVYSFRYAPTGENPPNHRIRYPPTKRILLVSDEGKFRGQSAELKKKNVDEIYKLFLSYVQGIHIG